ncbi:hypothetical protein [Parablautia intestinalis]|uniref:hypothetical protein n=2 Tax=Parablautia intestinalis TaxID=2320100 RepID=UPI00256F28C3|nr:hypothetical protein [Parablautia intestinalis]
MRGMDMFYDISVLSNVIEMAQQIFHNMAIGWKVLFGYAVICRSVVMENLQYAADIALGFLSYFICIFVFINLWGYVYGEVTPSLPDIPGNR